MTELTVLMPAYNEEACIRQAVKEVQSRVLNMVTRSRLLVINDGSTDNTGIILDRLAARHPNVQVLHKRNGGHGHSLMFGMNRASSEYLLLLDADRQIPLRSFARHWRHRAPNAFVCGVRRNRKDPLHRLVLTLLLRTAIRCMFGRRIRDGNAPYKIVPMRVWRNARAIIPNGTLTPSLFLAVIAACDANVRFVEVPVRHLARRSGKVSLVSWRLLRFCAVAAKQLVMLRWRIGMR